MPAALEGGDLAVFLVDPKSPGVTLTPLETTSGQPASKLVLDGVKLGGDALLGGEGGRLVLEWLHLRATAALCAMGVGSIWCRLQELGGPPGTVQHMFNRR